MSILNLNDNNSVETVNNIIAMPLKVSYADRIQKMFSDGVNFYDVDSVMQYMKTLIDNKQLSTHNITLFALKDMYKKTFETFQNISNAIKVAIQDMLNNLKAVKIDSVVTTDKVVSNEVLEYVKYNMFEKKGCAITWFLLNTGLRISECLNIAYDDIKTIDNNTVSINIVGKGLKTRHVTIAKNLVDLIASHYNNTERGYLFSNDNGVTKINRITMNNQIAWINKRFNTSYTPHSMRHTFVTKMLKAKQDITSVSKYVGHSSVNTTLSMYNHNSFNNSAVESALMS